MIPPADLVVALQFVVPNMALKVLDRSMQAFGAEGICQDQPLAQMWAGLRTLRYADVSLTPVTYVSKPKHKLTSRVVHVPIGPRRSPHAANRKGRIEACASIGRAKQADQGETRGARGPCQGQALTRGPRTRNRRKMMTLRGFCIFQACS